jgi:hypothetical protein
MRVLGAMARYYLNLRNGGGYVEDPEGLELPDLAAARLHAIEGIRSVLSEEARRGEIDLRGSIEIADRHGNILLVLPFSDAVNLRLNEKSA